MTSKPMDCLNQRLKREVDRVNPTVNQPPIDARSALSIFRGFSSNTAGISRCRWSRIGRRR
jgi:hypothetical protein